MNKLVEFAQEILKNSLGVNFEILSQSPNALLTYVKKQVGWAVASDVFYRDNLYSICSSSVSCIYELHHKTGIFCLIYNDCEDNELWILGPALTEPLNETYLRTRLYSQGLEMKTVQELIGYISSFPLISVSSLSKTMSALISHIKPSGTTIPYERLDLGYDRLVSAPIVAEKYENMEYLKNVERRYELSSALVEAVKQGNLSLAMKLLNEFSLNDTSVRSQDPLRNRQNYCIILNSQLRYALENSGIHPYKLDKFSNEIAEKIERIRSISEIEDFIFDTIRGYCDLAQEEALAQHKPLIKLAIAYIKAHLSDNISVKETANELSVNPDYLSNEFHLATGMTFIDFVNKERISQATSLLKRTGLQIQQIAIAVGYNNTSYFSKQFKKLHGKTPQEYRNG